MLKKLLVGGASLFCACLSAANAGVYLGPTLVVRSTVTNYSTVRELSGRMSLGYGDYLDNVVYLAGEIFLMPGSILLTNKTSVGDSAKSSYSFGASVLPAMKITDMTRAFLRIGIIESKFTSPNTNRVGGQGGLGLETVLNENWNLRFEYDYTVYRSISSMGTPRSDWFGLGAIYRFDAV